MRIAQESSIYSLEFNSFRIDNRSIRYGPQARFLLWQFIVEHLLEKRPSPHILALAFVHRLSLYNQSKVDCTRTAEGVDGLEMLIQLGHS